MAGQDDFSSVAKQVPGLGGPAHGGARGPVPELAGLDGQTVMLALIDLYPGPAWLVDGDGVLAAVNATGSTLHIRTAVAELATESRRSGRALTRRLSISRTGVAGDPLALELTVVPTGPGEDAVTAVFGRDVTFERNLTAALVASRELYRDLVQCSGDFAWETDAEGVFTFISVRGALGFEAMSLVGRAAASLLDPERQAPDALPFLAVEAVEDVEIWVRGADGEPRCMSVNALPMTDGRGVWVGARGVCRDVTVERERQAALDRLAERERVIDGVIEAMRSAPEPTAMLSMAVNETAAAARAEVWLLRRDAKGLWYPGAGPARSDAALAWDEIGQGLEESGVDRTQDWRIGTLRYLARATRFGDGINGALILVHRKNQGPFSPTAAALIDALVGPLGIAIAQADQIERLERLSSTDELTGLLNRRAFADEAGRRIAMGRRQPRSAVFLYMDLDHFKPINDMLGHQAGDLMLRRVGQMLARTSRTNDLAVRLGGDEFGLWLDATDMAGAVTKAEVLLQTLPTLAPEMPAGVPRLGISIGLAAIGDGVESLEEVIARADTALYAVKRAGRGGWRVAPPPPASQPLGSPSPIPDPP